MTSGPHNGRFGINRLGVPQALRNGLDFARRPGEHWPIVAAASGKVVRAGCYLKGSEGLGCMVEIDHGEGWQSLYGHMVSDPRQDAGLVVGRRVAQGRLLGHAGATGYAFGVHLHFEIRRNGHAEGREWAMGNRTGWQGRRLDGWTVNVLPRNYKGFLAKRGEPRHYDVDCHWKQPRTCTTANGLDSTNGLILPAPGA